VTRVLTRVNGSAEAEPEQRTPGRRGDRIFARIALTAGISILAALVAVFLFLAIEGWSGFTAAESTYRPATDFLGYIGPLILSTVLTAAVALVLAVPFAIGIALFVSHYAPRRLAAPVASVIDLLAAVPSVVFGLWGGRYLAGFLQPSQLWMAEHLSFLPFFQPPPTPNGRSLFTAGVVLAIMILPIITAISREVFAQTPRLHEEAALALGATRWEMVRYAVFPYARSGMVSATMLGLGRALGETMAVAMVLAVSPVATLNLVGTAAPATIASNIALNYKEATPSRQSLLIATGLVLFAITFVVNFAGRWIVDRNARKQARA
jgi:phosphate transport system permease protein